MPGMYTVTQNSSKAISIDQFPEEAWRMVLGSGVGESRDLKRMWEAVPWLNRGVGILAAGLAKMPFVIMNLAGEELTTSDDYEDVTGFWPNPVRDLMMAEMALKLFGSYYALKQVATRRRMTAPAGERGIRYWMPNTVRAEIDASTGLLGFTRSLSGRAPEFFKAADVLHIWLPDPFGEVGPPSWSPATTALSAAGVLASVDEFVTAFFERGAIKTTMLSLEGSPVQAERERIKSLWGRIMRGMKTAFGNLVINAGAVKPVVIGEGLESLTNSELTQERREDISTALGVPQSMLFSNAANFSVKEGDKRDMYEETIIPDGDMIAQAFNEQWLEPLGYRLQFRAHQMDIFQEDEEDRSGAILNLMNSLVNAPSPELGALTWQVMGVELPGGMEYDELERMLVDAKEAGMVRAAEIANGSGPGGLQSPTLRPVEGTVPDEEDAPEVRFAWQIDMEKWERKALKRLAKGDPAACDFTSDVISDELNHLIRELLEDARTPEQVRAIFRAEAI